MISIEINKEKTGHKTIKIQYHAKRKIIASIFFQQ